MTGPSAEAPAELASLFAEALAALQQLHSTAQPLAEPNPPAPAAGPFDLTVRELEVLRLAAEGLTDPQIAGRLVISRRTVNAHLRSIYSKLNVPSRTAATRLALERNLL